MKFNVEVGYADTFNMAKIYRKSQMQRVLGRQVSGFEMHKYGLPFQGTPGAFHASNPDHVDMVLAAVERYPELHIVTGLMNGQYVNRYEEENADVYYLYPGIADPEIEFSTEWDPNDFTPEEYERSRKAIREFLEKPLDLEAAMAVQWFLTPRSE